MDRRMFLGSASAALLMAPRLQAAASQSHKDGVMLLNRIGPSQCELYVANADGSGERKFLQNSVFDYHPSYSADGKWVLFTSERNGLGQSDVFRARADGTGIQSLVTGTTSPAEQACRETRRVLTASCGLPGPRTANGWPSPRTAIPTGAATILVTAGNTRRN